ncbi:MAG TPA: flagellar hook capping FlgD N-terminal domain-containing protein [Candidatus Hydrogenedentes bacterium]|nr:flagellar hook capping FlgD N-terminal domain-containing protein [Candidatus Hydrogenedentota bacterium]HPG67899.1 flagellar hook capping FlgD N-terminal domain-containing protein [Candidatus Hydrogenedentota bacterium]
MNALVAFRTDGIGVRTPIAQSRRDPTPLSSGKQALSALKSTPSAQKSSSDGTASRTVDQELDRDAFLQLLVTEMQYQDPLEPVDNAQMLAQLAQFSALEQMDNLNDGFDTLSGNIDQLNFISATSLLGQQVTGVDMNGQLREGVVERVHLDGSIVYLTVDGALMSMAGVTGIGTQDDESSGTSGTTDGAKTVLPFSFR